MHVFDGEFADWEEADQRSRERALAAVTERSAAARNVERTAARQKTDADERARNAARTRQRELERAESRVSELDARVATLTTQLADPELYIRPGGKGEADALARGLEAARADLAAAVQEWERAMASAGEVAT